MSGRGFQLALLLAGGAIVWLRGHQSAAHAAPAAVTPFHAVCPAVLPAGVVPLHGTAGDWTASAPAQWPVDGSGMLHGPADGQAYLVPDSARTTRSGARKTHVRRWTLGSPHQNETWVYCAYGPVELARRIPVDATECTVTVDYLRQQRGQTVFDCK